MFVEWGFLLAEIWVLIVLAALVGLVAGWLIWGGRTDTGADADEVRRLRAELERARAQNRASLNDPLNDIPPMEGGGYKRLTPVTPPTPVSSPEPAPDPVPDPAPAPKPVTSTSSAGVKPKGLDAPRDGLPDDLTKIKGVGAKLQEVCNDLGYWHFDQIAAWTDEEIAWVDKNLEGFKGRVTRDGWVEQAKALAVNETPAFVRGRD